MSFSFCQNIKVSGKVTDSIGNALTYANIIAEPKNDNALKFAITDNEGFYNLNLKKNETYNITISYIGFKPNNFVLKPTQNIVKNSVLLNNLESLDEITLNYKPPVTIKEDTIVYRTDVFKTGEERKLRDVLKKLPGVEVDRDGGVTVLGKKVKKVLVENKTFFTGDSKLAVNNIPADAVDEIEVLDNYNDVGFLKGLSDSEDMALNIKLKEDKKKFAFGDIEVGGGVKERYEIHPSLFYYSPKTSVNAIGDFNNTGKRNFTLKDYLDFNGGIGNLLTDRKSYNTITNDFSDFLNTSHFKDNRNLFGAFSINKSITTKTELESYIISANNKSEKETLNNNTYISNNDIVLENRIQTNQFSRSNFSIGKVALKHKPNGKTDIKFNTSFKILDNFLDEKTTSSVLNDSNQIIKTSSGNNGSIKQNIELHKQLKLDHTVSFAASYNYKKETPETNWLTNTIILDSLVNLTGEPPHDIHKNKKFYTNNLNLIFKHYWEINNFNHLYTSVGSLLAYDAFSTLEYESLSDNSINDFYADGFGNDINLNFKDFYLGLTYKFKIGKITFNSGVFYHKYYWNITQNNTSITKQKNLLLPEVTIGFKSKLKNRVTIKYALKSQFPQITQLASRFTLIDFNTVYLGNQNLENERFHNASINFNRFSIYRNIFYNFSISYRVKEENIKNEISIQDIDYISSPILSNFQDKTWSINGDYRKVIGKFSILAKTNLSFKTDESIFNAELFKTKSTTTLFGTGIRTGFDNLPNLEANYTKSLNKYQTNSSTFNFENDQIEFDLEYDFLKDFIFKANYTNDIYKNKSSNTTNTFDVANASLFYQKEDSPWGFEVNATNLFNVTFKQQNSFSSFLVSDSKTFILPRIIMLKLSYKL